jgi:CO/xanthine dehydrogenase FAD-binding subunit
VPYFTPRTVEEALHALSDPRARILAGGTDFYPALGEQAATFPIVDVARVEGLRGITRTADGGFRIGATTTWTDIVRAELPAAFDGLKAAALEVGSVQIQNAGTIAGNLCNASPAADGVPPLMTLGAEVDVAGPHGRRRLALSDFIVGARRTALKPGELLEAVIVPPHGEAARSAFGKLGARRYLVISIAMVAALIVPDGGGRVAKARVAVGACAAVACRLPALEAALVGAPLSALGECVDRDHLVPLSPIDDVRGTARYRRDAVETMLRRVLDAAGTDHAATEAA